MQKGMGTSPKNFGRGGSLVVVVYHVTFVAIGYGMREKLYGTFYALQGVPLYETMQTRLLP